jgi:phosphotransacetylase
VSLQPLLERAAAAPVRLLLSGGNPAALGAAVRRLDAAGVRGASVIGPGGVEPGSDRRLGAVAARLRSRRPELVHDGIHALDLAADPMLFALALIGLGEADALVSGPGISPQALAAAAEWTLGPPEDGGSIGSACWLLLGDGRLVGFAECALTYDLDEHERERLAGAVARVHRRLTGREPGVARLEVPNGSKSDPPARFRDCDDVLIFPDLTAGFFAVRTARALADASMLGPLLLGPPGVVAGVADDADEDELVGTAAVAVLAAGRTGT